EPGRGFCDGFVSIDLQCVCLARLNEATLNPARPLRAYVATGKDPEALNHEQQLFVQRAARGEVTDLYPGAALGESERSVASEDALQKLTLQIRVCLHQGRRNALLVRPAPTLEHLDQ